jgi:hypothetical protein
MSLNQLLESNVQFRKKGVVRMEAGPGSSHIRRQEHRNFNTALSSERNMIRLAGEAFPF